MLNCDPTQLLELETELEHRLAADPIFQRGIMWGAPRSGHPEGAVLQHICEVLANIETFYAAHPNRARLRLIALAHDTLKYKRDESQVDAPKKHHGQWAREWAEKYIDDVGVLEVIEWHDEPFRIYRRKLETGDETAAHAHALALIQRLGPHLELFMQFYQCDTLTGDKSMAHLEWFKHLVATRPALEHIAQ